MSTNPLPISFACLAHTGHFCDDLPLGLGMVAAYASEHYHDGIDAHLFTDANEFTAFIDDDIPPVVCFSTYVWNFRLSYEITRRIKERSPGTVIVYGGPNFPLIEHEQRRFLAQHPAIDFFVFREGEKAFIELLAALKVANFDANAVRYAKTDLPNTYYLSDGELITGTPMAPIAELDEISSPYLSGLLDKFLANPKMTPLMQFARGCPFKCTFCQEGEAYFNKVRRFPTERVVAEIRYIAERTKAPVMQLADSNFGMYKGDLEICHEIAAIQEELGWPEYVVDFSGKNQKQRVLDAVEIIHGSHFLSAAIQSTDPDVLKAVKRENVDWDQMIYVAQRGGKLDANSFAEIILALPHDTKEAHLKSICDLIDADLNVVRSHQFLLLQGSSGCSDTARDAFQMDARFRVVPNTVVPYTIFGETFFAPEIDEICVGNSTMSFEDYLECRTFNLTTELFYNNGIFDELCKFLRVQDISISAWIRNIHYHVRTADGPLTKIYDDFLRESCELWRDQDELITFLTDPAVIEKYRAGEMGNNEQILYRTRAIFNHMEELHRIAFIEAHKLLAKDHTPEPREQQYLDELRELSLIRKSDVLTLDEVAVRKFHFDFSALETEKFNPDPVGFYRADGVEVRLGHSQSQKSLINKYKDQYGESEKSIGYMLSSIANFNNFYRTFQ